MDSSPAKKSESAGLSSELLHHGAAANSSSKATVCIPSFDAEGGSSEIAYASHSILNIAHRVSARFDSKQEPIWTVHQTLRTCSRGSVRANTTVSTLTAKRRISCVSLLKRPRAGTTTLLCGFSDGTISSWRRQQDMQWIERLVVQADDAEFWDGRSITDISGISESDHDDRLCVVACSSGGAVQYRLRLTLPGTGISMEQNQLLRTPANTVDFYTMSSQDDSNLLFVGTAAPRHNKIHVFVVHDQEEADPSTHYSGFLSGHEDWITCFDWSNNHLASGSQDARIRLWKLTTNPLDSTDLDNGKEFHLGSAGEGGEDHSDDEIDEKEIEEGESRLEIVVPQKAKISVSLEALLIGHEERVTSVRWHPNPKPVYGEEFILFSSSMDRSIFVWGEVSGVWAPISRVGSAGGILGGSVGSSLLGFLNIELEPCGGMWMMGHAYGGSLHFFSCEQKDILDKELNLEDRAALSPWRAQPCLTGHFDHVTDLCWESAFGDYLVTVGNDQTCRIWVPLEQHLWVEIARPQVHGYNLSSVTSVSTKDRRHMLVSAADEKELRVFDATKSFTALLSRICERDEQESMQRVDRAFIPSLGLSNKGNAKEGAEQDGGGMSESSTQLPLERDLGAISLWPEILKLYGHNTELIRVISTTTPKNGVLVASCAKAREANDAGVRLWSIDQNRCLQTLTGGHRSSVTALSFSPDANFLVTSGKDRRICLWERQNEEFCLAYFIESAHKRIVWGVHFCPFDSTILSSCSRDGTIKLWRVLGTHDSGLKLEEKSSFTPHAALRNEKPEAVTSLAIAPSAIMIDAESNLLIAIGLENGLIEFWAVPMSALDEAPTLVHALSPVQCHAASVTRLAWRPIEMGGSHGNYDGFILASASADHGCRIWRISKSR